MLVFDRWILEKNSKIGKKILKAYKNYEYHIVYHTIYNFFTIDLSSFYLDVLKDRLYCSGKDSFLRKSAQTALFELLKSTLVLMAPVLPFTSEEAWEVLPGYKDKAESVHLESFPQFEDRWLEPETFKEWEDLVSIREKVLKELENARENKLFGNSLEARVSLVVPSAQMELLKKYEKELPVLFIVSDVNLSEGAGQEVEVEVTQAEGEKCQRCWNFSTYVGTSENYPLFCQRCEKVVEGLGL